MRRPFLCICIVALAMAGCTGGAAGDPSDDIGDILVFTHSPGNGDTVRVEDSLDGFNALNNPTLTNPGAVTVVFTNSLDLSSVINADPADPQTESVPANTGPPTNEVQRLNVNLPGEPDSLDPQRAVGSSSIAVLKQIYAPLVELDQNGSLRPIIAKEVPTVANGGHECRV